MVDSGHKEGFPCGFCRGYGAASREVWVLSLGQMAIAFPIPPFLQWNQHCNPRPGWCQALQASKCPHSCQTGPRATCWQHTSKENDDKGEEECRKDCPEHYLTSSPLKFPNTQKASMTGCVTQPVCHTGPPFPTASARVFTLRGSYSLLPCLFQFQF